MFRKVLIANRGEIAVRVIRTLREMGIAPVAVYSDADRASLHVRMADEAAHVGPSPSAESYLRIDRILDAARDAWRRGHPSRLRISQRECRFRRRLRSRPASSSSALRRIDSQDGIENGARGEMAMAAGAPVVPGGGTRPRTPVTRRAPSLRDIGYPRAAQGRGRRRRQGHAPRGSRSRAGLRLSRRLQRSRARLSAMPRSTSRSSSSGPATSKFRLLGDRHGHMIHLGERECSLQRRHQKVIEECPSPLRGRRIRRCASAMGEAAIRVARAAGYYNAGTVEFLVDARAATSTSWR